jgi:hypothetical protein
MSVAVSALGLVVFHGALFWNQIGEGRLLDPAVAARWSMAALLLMAMAALRRAGVPLLWGRRALVVWVLIALLHWTAAPAADGGTPAHGGAIGLLFVDLPAGASVTLLTASLFLLILLGGRVTPRSTRALGAVSSPAAEPRHAPLLSGQLASRAPPSLAA